MILVFQFFRLSQKVRFFISPVSYCFDVSRKPRHGKMHEVRYRKICVFNSVEDCFLYNCGYSSSFPLSRSVMLHFPTRFHQNQKRMLSFEDHFSFSTANSSHNVQTSETRKLASQIVYHHQVNLQEKFKTHFRHFFVFQFVMNTGNWSVRKNNELQVCMVLLCRVFQQWSQKHDFSETWFYRNSFLVLSGTKRWF